MFLRFMGYGLLAIMLGLSAPVSVAQSDRQPALKGKLLLMRHALAPGFGDPDHFVLGDCATQRNLDAVGRQQAKTIGQQLREAGILPTTLYSSQWCRCLETAKLLDLGQVQPHPGLNSYFQGIVDRQQTLARLTKLIQQLKPQRGPYLFVTHQVVIADLTGIFPSSGEIIVYDFITGQSERLALK